MSADLNGAKQILVSALNYGFPWTDVCELALFFASFSPEEVHFHLLCSWKPSTSTGPVDSAVVTEVPVFTIGLL
jgi:hypothetical protein